MAAHFARWAVHARMEERSEPTCTARSGQRSQSEVRNPTVRPVNSPSTGSVPASATGARFGMLEHVVAM
ncbi:hypothetical protein HPB52_017517 [Rhipicephalus sanguineus]|uniref:Uncharacterized protein n=1 Tax=Rhipicephalus sanguineus TaxID=34632 RepID=A0A9D4PEP9_RHISA|nr:hypothetical protein HPB52_017517 [Rhipicephalus sanguineus]